MPGGLAADTKAADPPAPSDPSELIDAPVEVLVERDGAGACASGASDSV